jgi:hypothetical protein
MLAALLLGAVGCGANDVGDECETPGSTDECVDRDVCERSEDDAVVCLLRCVDQGDCGPDENCNGVTHGGEEIKACHPKNLGE